MLNYSSSTASKQPHRFPSNYPKEIVKGKGVYIYDKKGNRYIDFMCSLGPIILGYRYPVVDEAVQKAIRDYGTIFSLSHPLERTLADILCEMVPCAEMVRFAHNGKDVTEAAIRLARHITGKEKVLSFSYHGASDVFIACSKTDKGVPKCLKDTIYDFDYNDFEAVKKYFDKYEIAAVILEPHTIRHPKDNFLKFLRDICTQNNALLIFDEIVTFPRYPGYSAQVFFGVTPDLTCVSKGMANGFPISALVGREMYMKHFEDGEVFFSTTFGGNLIGVSAAIATLKEVMDKDVPSHLWKMGTMFNLGIGGDKLEGIMCRQFFKVSDIDRQKIMQEMLKRGVFFGIPILFNYSMKPKHIKEVVNKFKELDLENIEIEGEKIKEVMKKK